LQIYEVSELEQEDNVTISYILSNISFGDNTLLGEIFLNILSPEKIEQSNFNANAKYCTSFKCLNINSLAFGKKSSNSDFGIKVICFITNPRTSLNSFPDNLERLNISCLCFSNSVNKNSGATNSNLLNISLIANTLKELPLPNNEESTTLTSTTTNISYSKYLCDREVLILLDILLMSFLVNLDLETIFFNRAISSNLDTTSLLTNIDQSMLEACLIKLNSSGILIVNSAITKDNGSKYLNVSNRRL